MSEHTRILVQRSRLGRVTRLGWRVVLAGILACAPGAFALTRQKFDFVVGVDGDFKAAMAAAAKASSSGKRFVMFFPDGDYNLGSLTGDANQMTTFPTANVSFVGQSSAKTVLFNQSINEGIGITATLYLKGANNTYMQDLAVLNKANYGKPETYNATGRHVAIQEQGNKMVYRNVRLLSTQDTYYTKGTRTYWEGGEIHGTTDFICGGGDVFFNKVLVYALKKSALIAPSSTNNTWGYVFKDCTIDGTVSDFVLARSWNDARIAFLNTTMKKLPTAAGWGDPMNSVPKVFAEYKSVNGSGAAVDLSKRRTSYTKDATTVTLKPVLTDAEAAKYTVANVLTGTDNWQPQTLTTQVAAPAVTLEGNTLRWNDDAKALLWAVFRNGKYLANVTTNSYTLASPTKGDSLTVRAANEMGGLGLASKAVVVGSTTSVDRSGTAALRPVWNASSRVLRVEGMEAGSGRLRLLSLDGSQVATRQILSEDPAGAPLDLSTLESGVYLLRWESAKASGTSTVRIW
jgi:pectin methylesterase-like acyl-CoA thioesterase